MYRLKKILLLGLLFSFQFNFSQTKEEKKYLLLFETLTDETYSYEIGNGKKMTEKKYIKEKKGNGDIYFYIKKELFKYVEKSKSIDTCSIGYLNKRKVSNIDNLKMILNEKNPLYPYKVFPNLYLIEKINDSTIVKYRVKWEYYIE